MLRTVIAAAVLFAPAATLAQAVSPGSAASSAGTATAPPQRIRSVQLTQGQACPKSSGDEIVVCTTSEEPYRIPKTLRNEGPIAAKNQSWVNRTAQLDQAGRVAGGLPDTCSTVGTGGQSGCALAANRAYAAERRAQADADANIP